MFSLKTNPKTDGYSVLKGNCSSFSSAISFYNAPYQAVAQVGETLYVALSPCGGISDDMDFVLDISAFETSDLCGDAVELGAAPLDTVEITGNSDDATQFFWLHRCTNSRRDPTVVYTMEGDGKAYRASLTGLVDNQSTVYIAYSNCTDVVCFGEAATNSWATIPGVTYYLAVVGDNPSTLGGFILNIQAIALLADCGGFPTQVFPRVPTTYAGRTREGAMVQDTVKGCVYGNRIYQPVVSFTFVSETGDSYWMDLTGKKAS